MKIRKNFHYVKKIVLIMKGVIIKIDKVFYLFDKICYPIQKLQKTIKEHFLFIGMQAFMIFSICFAYQVKHTTANNSLPFDSNTVEFSTTVKQIDEIIIRPRTLPMVALSPEEVSSSTTMEEVVLETDSTTEPVSTFSEISTESETTTIITEESAESETVEQEEIETETTTPELIEQEEEESDYEYWYRNEYENLTFQISPYDSIDEYIYLLMDYYDGYDTRIEMSYENIYLLGQVAYAEAGDQPLEGKVAVCEVCLNRIDKMKKQNIFLSLHDIIYSPQQFSVVDDGSIHNIPTEEEIFSAIRAILGDIPSDGSLYFDDPNLCTSWASKNRKKSKKIGDHQFYY